jgi:hypothetical protein
MMDSVGAPKLRREKIERGGSGRVREVKGG